MDYEKKYKQLHTLISDLYLFMSEYCKEKVEGFFPELKESEDEQIRKKIIALFKGQIPSTSGEDNKKFVAWLEKQGEQKPDWSNKEKLMLNDIIEATERSNIFMEDYQRELVDWLKSLKQRIAP